MAKKEKVTLTPEEIEAKKARKKEKRIIFGKTFERAIVWLLAVVLVYSVTYISLNNKGVAAVSAAPSQSGSQNAGGSASKSDWDTSANGSGSSQSGSQSSTSGDNASGGNAAAGEAGVDAAAAAEAINAATAKAVAAAITGRDPLSTLSLLTSEMQQALSTRSFRVSTPRQLLTPL